MIRMSRERQERQALVAFAIVVPVFLLLLPEVNLGLLLYNQHVITNGSRKGARSGTVLAIPLLLPNSIGSPIGGRHLRSLATRKYD